MLSKHAKNKFAARAGEAILQQLPVEEKTLRRVGWLMEPKHLKQLGIAAVAGTAAFRMSAYRLAVARELKKQLDPVNRKLNELERQNEELKAQNEKLQEQLEKR